MAQHTRPEIPAELLQGFEYVRQLRPLLDRLHDCATARDRAHNRVLFYDHYVTLLLLYFFNPVLTSLRGLQQATHLDKVRAHVGIGRVSLGALSEATGAFDPDRLRAVVQELAGRVATTGRGREAEALRGLTAVDGSFLPARPRMAWAVWRDDTHRAAKLHLAFEVLTGVPVDATVTPGASSEPDQLRALLRPGRVYVIDRGYAGYPLFRDVLDAGSSFIGRVQDNTTWTRAEDRPLTPAARAAGVVRDLLVARLGTGHHADVLGRPVRVVIVRRGKPDGTTEDLWRVTDRLDLDPERIGLAYRYRWSVELFFRWFKCLLGCRHLVAADRNGVTIQVYVALIASLLVVVWTGRVPTKRMWEMIRLYVLGWATLAEVEAYLAAQARKAEPKKTPVENSRV
ncbi:MAG TPA: IS4 family transposase [Urbifossiella sp.]|jgi:hypothetical protein|nr:IS4 family transposase [Urbifossiella sp.]